jgi:hypothetical protein
LIGRGAARTAYRLASATPVVADFAALTAEEGPAAPPVSARAPEATLAFEFRNRTAATFRHPDPIEPARVRLRWHAGGAVVREDERRLLLPIALTAGETQIRQLAAPTPPPGTYEVTLARAEAPDVVLARRTVQVAAPTS